MSNLVASIETLIYHQLGIVPLTYDDKDINRVLMSLPADESRRIKRKFRKLWRKESNCRPPSMTKQGRQFARGFKAQAGYGVAGPTKTQKYNRKMIVMRRVKIMTTTMMRNIRYNHVLELGPIL